MIASLKPYPTMKDSGVPWLGEVPWHWEVSTLRRYLRPYEGIKIGPFGSQLKLDQMSEEGYKVYGQANVIARDFTRGIKFVDKEKFEELSACELRPGDLVMTMMGTSGRCALVPEKAIPGIMDSHLLRLRMNSNIKARFAALVIDESPYVKEQITVAGKGSIMHGLNSGMVKDIILALPNLPEQAAIVRFLDHYDRKIRRYIRAKQKLINLLEEQKQAIIHSAVTRGLDPNVRLKPSGVDWLGDVPQHWDLLQIRHFAKVGNGSTPSRGSSAYWSNGTYPWLNSSSVNIGTIIKADQFVTETALVECHLPRVEPGSVLVAITGQGKTRGTAAVLKIEATINQHIAYITPRKMGKNALPEYLKTFLMAAYSELRRISEDSGSTKGALTCEDLKHFRVALPPIEEQKRINNWLNQATYSTVVAINSTEREISLLREYRTRLIADMVTGKLDVRAAAAHIPEETEELEPIEETNGPSDVDEEPEVVEDSEE